MATLPNLKKGVTKDPTPPATDTETSPITIPDGTTLVTTKTTNETIDNVDQIIDYISGDNSPNFIPQSAIGNLVPDLTFKENINDKNTANGYAGLDGSTKLQIENFPTGTALQVLRRDATNNVLEFVDPIAGDNLGDHIATQDLLLNDNTIFIDTAQNDSIFSLPPVPLVGGHLVLNHDGNAEFDSIDLSVDNINRFRVTIFHLNFTGLKLINTGNIEPETLNTSSIGLSNKAYAELHVNEITLQNPNRSVLNIGHLDFTVNAPAPTAVVSLYSDGVNLFAKTGGGTVNLSDVGGGSGDVVGPASATDNAIARFNLETGKLIQNSQILLSDLGVITDVAGLIGENVTNPAGFFVMENAVDLLWENNAADGTFGLTVNGVDELSLVNGVLLAENWITNQIEFLGTSDVTNDRLLIFDNVNGGIKKIAPEDLGLGGSGITSINTDTTAAQIITGTTNLIVITQPVAGTTNINIGSNVATSTDNLSFFSATTSAQLAGVISDETGTGVLVFGTTPTIVTPTIASFVNAGHNHEDVIGGGVLVATLALTATGTKDSTTFLRGDDTWAVPAGGGGSGNVSYNDGVDAQLDRQIVIFDGTDGLTIQKGGQTSFEGPTIDVAGSITMKRNLLFSPTTGSPSATDEAIFSSVGTLIINSGAGTIITIGLSNVLNINANGIQLNNKLISNVLDPVSDQDVVTKAFGDANYLGGGSGDVVGPGSSTDNAIAIFSLETGKLIQQSGSGAQPILIDDNANMSGIRALIPVASNTFPLTSTAYFQYGNHGQGSLDFEWNVLTGNKFRWTIQGTQEYNFTATEANFLTNNIVQQGAYHQFTSISSPTSTGNVAIGRLFLDADNSHHVTIQRNGVEVDLEAAGGGSGDVVGPASATDNAIAIFNLETGKLIKNGVITIDGSANMQLIRSAQFSNFNTQPGAALTWIQLNNAKFQFNTTVGNSHVFSVNGTNVFSIGENLINFHSNNLRVSSAYIELNEIGDPAAPNSNIGRLYIKNVGGRSHLHIRDDVGVVDIQAGGSGNVSYNDGVDAQLDRQIVIFDGTDGLTIQKGGQTSFEGPTIDVAGSIIMKRNLLFNATTGNPSATDEAIFSSVGTLHVNSGAVTNLTISLNSILTINANGIQLNNKLISNVLDPVSDQDVVTKAFGDANYLGGGLETNLSNLSSPTIPTVDLSLNGNKLTGVTQIDASSTVDLIFDITNLQKYDFQDNGINNTIFDASTTEFNIYSTTTNINSSLNILSVDPDLLPATLKLFRDDLTPVIDDDIGNVTFEGNNSVGARTQYASWLVQMENITDGNEIGKMILDLADDGNIIRSLEMSQGVLTINRETDNGGEFATLNIRKTVPAALGGNDGITNLNFQADSNGLRTFAAISVRAEGVNPDAGEMQFKVLVNSSTLRDSIIIFGDEDFDFARINIKDKFSLDEIENLSLANGDFWRDDLDGLFKVRENGITKILSLSTSFIGFTADAELDMDSEDIISTDRLLFTVDSGVFPAVNDVGFVSSSSGLTANIPNAQSHLWSSSGNIIMELIREGFGSNNTSLGIFANDNGTIPKLELHSLDTTPTNNSQIAQINFFAKNSIGINFPYAGIISNIVDTIFSDESGELEFSVVGNGNFTVLLNIRGSSLSNTASVIVGADLDINTFDIINTDRILFDQNTGTSLGAGNTGITSNSLGNMAYNVLTGGIHDWNINGGKQMDMSETELTLRSIDLSLLGGNNIVLDIDTGTKIGTATNQKLGFFDAIPIIQPLDGATLTNNVTSGGVTDTIANFDANNYNTDAATIRDDIFQLARKVKMLTDNLRDLGLES